MSENNIDNNGNTFSMDDHELLMKLARQQKSAMWLRRITAYVEVLILVLLVAGFMMIGPKLVTLISDLTATLEKANQLIDSAQPAVDNLSKLDYEALGTSIDTLTQSVEKFSGFMNNLSSFGGLFR